MDGPQTSSSGVVSVSALPRPRLLVRRVRRGLGCSPRSRGRFGPLVSGRGFSFHQCEGVVGCGEGSSPFSLLRQPFHGRGVCRQLHGRGLFSQRRGHSISSPQFHCPSYPQMVRTPPCPPGSPVHRGAPQCSGRLSLSRPDQIQGSVWTLHMEVFLELRRQWPVMIDLFATSANHRCSIYFLPFRDPQAMRTNALLQSWDHLQAYAFPPWAMIPQVLHKLRSSSGANSDRPLLASEALVPRSAGPSDCPTGTIASSTRSPQPASLSSSWSPQALSSCLEPLQRFARAAGFSSRVAAQVGLAQRSSSRTNYQLKWSVYRQWCRSVGHSISWPSLPKIADFLLWLRRSRNLSVSSVMGYRSMLATVFRFQLPNMSSDPVLRDLVRSFRIEAPVRPLRPPVWDLSAVLQFLNSSVFELLHQLLFVT